MNVDLPCGIYNTRYEKDMAIVRTKVHWAWLIAGVVLSVVVPPMLGAHGLSWCVETCIVVVAVLGLYFVTGLCGQISLGQAGFMAVGAYTTAMLMGSGMSYWLAFPIASLTAGVLAIVFGLPSLRVKGFYLAMATLASQHVLVWVLTHPPLERWSGGFDGLTTPAPQFGSFEFSSNQTWFYVVVTIMWIAIYFAKNVGRTRTGRCFVAIRDSDLAAEVLGVNIFQYKVLAFFLSGVYAGVAGGLFAPYITQISPENFNIGKSIWFLGMLVVGGSGSVVGAIAGVVFLRLLLELTTMFGPTVQVVPVLGSLLANYLSGIVFGLVIILFLIFEPRGLNHRWEVFKSWYRMYPFSY